MVQGLSLILIAFLLSGCMLTVNSDAWVKPILISKDDRLTEQTAADIAIHNETWERNK